MCLIYRSKIPEDCAIYGSPKYFGGKRLISWESLSSPCSTTVCLRSSGQRANSTRVGRTVSEQRTMLDTQAAPTYGAEAMYIRGSTSSDHSFVIGSLEKAKPIMSYCTISSWRASLTSLHLLFRERPVLVMTERYWGRCPLRGHLFLIVFDYWRKYAKIIPEHRI